MSDIDPTPDTPTTIGDRLAWFRGDIGNRLLVLRNQLEALQGNPSATLAALHTELVTGLDQIQIDILGIRGTPETTLRDIWSRLSIIESAIDQTLPSIKAGVSELNERLDNIQSVLGAEPYSSLETGNIRALLNALVTSQGNIGISPDGTAANISSATTTSLNGRRYVVWNSDIPGLTRSNSNTSLTPTVSWDGYQIYVQSNAETCWINADEVEWPTNSWLTAPLSGTIAVSVPSQYNVRAFIRYPDVIAFTITSTLLDESGQQLYFSQWPEGFSRSGYLGASNVFASFDPYGWEFRSVDSGIIPLKCEVSGVITTYDIPETWFTVTGHFAAVWAQRWQGAGPWTMQARPPA